MKKTIKSKIIYQNNIQIGYDLEWSVRMGFLYEPFFNEFSLYLGPFRLWVSK